MSVAKARLLAIVEQAAKAVTDPATGRFEQKAHVDELRARLTPEDLPPHVQAAAFDLQCQYLATSFAARRTPKPSNGGGLFHPERVLSLGKGMRVWMKDATPEDLMRWGGLSVKNTAAVLLAEATRQEYVASRIECMKNDPNCRTLGPVECQYFGYSMEDVQPLDGDGLTADEDDDFDA